MSNRHRRRLDTRTWFRRNAANHAHAATSPTNPLATFFTVCWVAWCQYRDSRTRGNLG